MPYEDDRRWSDQFIPDIKRLVGPHLLIETPLEIDRREAADLMIFRATNLRIAARVRRKGWADRYPYEFTIRSHRDSGAETELSKIAKGFGDWMFYGHEASPGTVGLWWLINLAAWRLTRNDRAVRSGSKSNGDGTGFAWYDLRSFPAHPPILIASSMPLPVQEPLL